MTDSNSSTAETPARIGVDARGHVDQLGRSRFAKYLLGLIAAVEADDGTVIGLEGEWGSGKTWILDQVESLGDDLPEKQSPVFIHFNPWMLSGSTELVEALLIQLASEFGSEDPKKKLARGEEIAGKLIDYTRVLGLVKHLAPLASVHSPELGLILGATGSAAEAAAKAAKEGVGPIIDQWKKAPAKLSLSAARKEVNGLLKSLDRRLVVFVDDLDRLAPSELAAMIQAVKAVANFPNTVYVLAYDRPATAHALEAALHLRESEGQRYLEKIVRLALPVPEIPAYKMQGFAINRLREVLQNYVEHDETEKKDLEAALPLAAALLQTPRDVARLRTRLAVIAKELSGNINLADLLLAEALGMKAAKVIEYVDANRAVLLELRSEKHDVAMGQRGELGDIYCNYISPEDRGVQERALRDEWMKYLPDDNKLAFLIRCAMAFMLDSAEQSDWERPLQIHATKNRLQRHSNWIRWRAAVRHDEIFENSEVANWFAKQGNRIDLT